MVVLVVFLYMSVGDRVNDYTLHAESKCLPQVGSVPFQVPSGPQALSDDPPTSWYPDEQL